MAIRRSSWSCRRSIRVTVSSTSPATLPSSRRFARVSRRPEFCSSPPYRGARRVSCGGSERIGLEVCRQLATKGFRRAHRAGPPPHEAAAHQLRASGLDVSAIVADLTAAASIRACADEAEARLGHVDVLINNAAVLLAEDRDLFATTADDLRQSFETNVVGVLAMCQACVPAMVARRYGRGYGGKPAGSSNGARGLRVTMPAATYSPTQFPMQYHRR